MNNGIFLCDRCAEKHKTFDDKYSYVRSLINYEWDYTGYLYMELGGNNSFKLFMTQYGLMQEMPEIRYKTLAAEYYRMKVFFNSTIQLYSLVHDTKFDTPQPSLEKGKELLKEKEEIGELLVGKAQKAKEKATEYIQNKEKAAFDYITHEGQNMAVYCLYDGRRI